MILDPLEIGAIHAAYRAGTLTPVALMQEMLARIAAWPDPAVFIARVPEAEVLARAAALAGQEHLLLFGVPFVVKDNMDVADMPTTAACPEFSFMPARDATVVAKLLAAGAILLGKANMDQFATGLNGTRSPHGAPRSVFNFAYVSGGSSSGSAVAVAAGLAAFSLGTDTAGSGRVPAAFNNIVGLKPTFGRISAAGVVPACRSLDCVSVFANSAADAATILQVAEGPDAADAYSRAPREEALPTAPRIGVLAPPDQDFGGDEDAAALYRRALATASGFGWTLLEIDYAPFRDIAAALYGGPLVAERLAAIRPFFEAHEQAVHPVLREILNGARKYAAADLFAEQQRLQALRVAAQAELARCDALLLPTAPETFTVADMLAAPVARNARLGIYTNFVNLVDLAAIALPAGFGTNGLPFGVTVIGPPFSEASLAGYAARLHAALGAGAGRSRAQPRGVLPPASTDDVSLVVAGAHLSGMALNHELLALGATLIRATETAADYRLYALATTPPKPGLARSPGFEGPGIAVEIWRLSRAAFGQFVAALPAPMGIGRVTLADGAVHPGFLCEAYALEGAADITAHGGWRAYLAAAAP